jgi:hypothetical protein
MDSNLQFRDALAPPTAPPLCDAGKEIPAGALRNIDLWTD